MTDAELPSSGGPASEDHAGSEALVPAGIEAPAWVGELLAGLRADDPPLPDDVAARIDAALAVLTPADLLPVEDSLRPDPAPGGDHEPGASTVIPLAARDRRAGGAGPWGHRLLLGGVAAAAALVLGGLGTVAVVRNSGGAGAGADATVADARGGEAAQVRYVASNQDYTKATLDTTTQAVLAASTSPLEAGSPPTSVAPSTAPGVDPSASATPTTPVPSGAVVLRAAADRPADSCVDSLAGSAAIEPLLVDEATYETRPAFVVVIGTDGDPGSADVWVVARTCRSGDEGVLAFVRIAR